MMFLWSAIQNNPVVDALLKVVDHKEEVKDISAYAQKHWLRKANQERFHMEEKKEYQEKKAFIHYCFQKLGMMNVVQPKKTHYDYVVIHGALASTMQERINFLKQLRPKIHYKQIVFLTGKRVLDPIKEQNYSTLKTEDEVAHYLMKKSGFKNFQIANATEFKGVRPNTNDTINAWKKMNPTPGSVLAISNNPYVPRQDLTLKKMMGSDFEIETVGSKTSANTKASVLFDELARLIYTEVMS